jgi:hypothetical protein
MWWQKDANGEAWYCSELVWAAYLHASNWQINIEHGPDWTGITPDEIWLDNDIEVVTVHYEEVSREGLLIETKCPVDLHVVDPQNLSINKQSIEIPGAIYGEDDIDVDGDLEDWIGISEPKIGEYLISVIPEPDALPTDTYSLEVTAHNETVVLAEDVQIKDIPSKPYIVRLTESGDFVLATIESCDSSGTSKDVFDINEQVYVKGSGYLPSTTYSIYLVSDTNWTDGMLIPGRIGGTATTTTSDASGNISLTMIWNTPLKPGKYDIIVDVNNDGYYNATIDALDESNTQIKAGLLVIPEYWLGTVLGLVACLAAFGLYQLPKRTRRLGPRRSGCSFSKTGMSLSASRNHRSL